MTIDATVWQRTDKTLSLVVYQSDGATPKDLTNFSIIAYRIGKRLTDATVLELTGTATDNGSVVEFGTRANGEVNITLARDDLDIPAMRYVHELILADGSGKRDNALTDSSEEDAYLTVKETLPAAS